MSVPPSAPRIVNTPMVEQPGQIAYAWWAPSDLGSPAVITGYRLTLEPGPIVSLTGPVTDYVVTGLTNTVTYSAIIEATNDNGLTYGPSARFHDFQTGSPPPQGPSTVTATAFGTNSASISWTPPTVLPDATIYWYVVTSKSSRDSDPILSTNGWAFMQSNVILSGLNPASVYTFNVEAVNYPGYSPILSTNQIQFTTIYTSSLIVYVDTKSNASYSGTGTTWFNLIPAYNSVNYMLGPGATTPTFSSIIYNGTNVSSFHFTGGQYVVNNTNMQSYLTANSLKETREFWFYWRGSNGILQNELGDPNPNSGWHDAQIVLSNNVIWFGYWQNGMSGFNVFNSLTSNRWYHLAYQFDGAISRLIAYVNGVETYNNLVAGRSYNGANYYLAMGPSDTTTIGGISGPFNGFLSVYRWYNTIVPASNILGNYNYERSFYGL
jgi:hypothetical protein